jgi:transcriptional regulator with XRE-family HTH domain
MDLASKKQQKRLNELSRRIREARVTSHLSQDDLGNAIGVSDKSISAYEQGRSTPPLAKLRKIAETTNYPLSYFTQEDNNEAILSNKLSSIERELSEVKRLLLEAKK